MSDQSANPVLFIVARLAGGYAREDSSTVDIVGCYTDETFARKVALGSSAKVFPTKLNTLIAGLLNNLGQLGQVVDLEALTCTIQTQGLIEREEA